ncbi:glycosyltransferase family 39 protein [Solimonas sp. SE-A11]|uniref:glycosyltransferase family 39 protein n=1 Tax=Solimonas sp. SE-A11 TaxID=3054954 RepID=UPI00259C98FD|nr:glycosyltransferase family 39 protein [Solimonas sp. SE-A11]MDM4772092.1 glycosyltransferase family 39 protein [Solimonas sp. SE-A11]
MNLLARPWPLFLLAVAVSLYRYWAWTLADGISLSSEEALYWTWAQSPDWGYYSKPPMIAWLIHLAGELWASDAERVIKAIPLLLYPLTTLLVYALGRRLYDPATGRDAALLFLLMPALFLSAFVVTPDVPLLLAWAAALWFLWAAVQGNRWRDWLLLGLCCGLGLLSRYSMSFFVFGVLAFALGHPAEHRLLLNPRLYVAAGIAALVLLPNVLWNLEHDLVTYRIHAEISQLGESLVHPGALFEFFVAQFGIFGPLSLALLVLGLARLPMWRRGTRELRFLLAFCAAPLLLICGIALLTHASATWAAPLYLAGAVLVAALYREQRPWILRALELNAVLGMALYHYPAVLKATGRPLEPRYDAFQQLRGWDQIGYQAQREIQEYGDLRLLTDDGPLTASLIYYARPLKDPRIWVLPGQPPQDHYQLTMPLQQGDDGPFLWVTAGPAATEVLLRFSRFERLPDLETESYPGLRRRYEAWRVEGFKGYEPRP